MLNAFASNLSAALDRRRLSAQAARGECARRSERVAQRIAAGRLSRPPNTSRRHQGLGQQPPPTRRPVDGERDRRVPRHRRGRDGSADEPGGQLARHVAHPGGRGDACASADDARRSRTRGTRELRAARSRGRRRDLRDRPSGRGRPRSAGAHRRQPRRQRHHPQREYVPGPRRGRHRGHARAVAGRSIGGRASVRRIGSACSSRSSVSTTPHREAGRASGSAWLSPAASRDAMRGELTIDDTPGGGTTMIVELEACP